MAYNSFGRRASASISRNRSEASATSGSTSQNSPPLPSCTRPGMGKKVDTRSNSVSSTTGTPGSRASSHLSRVSGSRIQRTVSGAGGTVTAGAERVMKEPDTLFRQGLSAPECVGKCETVNIAQLATHRDAMGQASDQDILAIQAVGDVVGSRLAFDGGIGRQDQFGHAFFAHPL